MTYVESVVQSFGCVVIADTISRKIVGVSGNTVEVLGIPKGSLLEASFVELFGSTVWHDVAGLRLSTTFGSQSNFMGVYEVNFRSVYISVYEAGGAYTFEFESSDFERMDANHTMRFLEMSISHLCVPCSREVTLKRVGGLLRVLTGFESFVFEDCNFANLSTDDDLNPNEDFVSDPPRLPNVNSDVDEFIELTIVSNLTGERHNLYSTHGDAMVQGYLIADCVYAKDTRKEGRFPSGTLSFLVLEFVRNTNPLWRMLLFSSQVNYVDPRARSVARTLARVASKVLF